MIVSALQQLRLRLSNPLHPFKVDEHLVTRLNQHDESPVHALIVGQPENGVHQLFQAMCGRLTGCVVLLTLVNQDIPGLMEAPYQGDFLPAPGTASFGMDLSDVLDERPAGVFRLELPTSVFDGQDFRGKLLQKGISDELRRMVSTTALKNPGSSEERITLMVEEGQQVLADEAVFMCSRFGRNANCSLVFAQQTPTPASVDLQMTADFLVAFGAQPLAADLTEPLLKLPEGSLSKLKAGQGWCRDRNTWKTSFFQLDASPARH